MPVLPLRCQSRLIHGVCCVQKVQSPGAARAEGLFSHRTGISQDPDDDAVVLQSHQAEVGCCMCCNINLQGKLPLGVMSGLCACASFHIQQVLTWHCSLGC